MKHLKQFDEVDLEINSWVGTNGDASHYYGLLKGYINGKYTFIEMRKALSKQDVDMLNQKDKHVSYYEGFESKRFNSEKELKDEAIKVWKSFFPDGKVLLEGCSAYIEPKVILDGIDKKIARKLNSMAKAYRKIPEREDKKQEKAYDEWITILLERLR